MKRCQVCGVEYEEVDYRVVWPHPGACLCSFRPSPWKERAQAEIHKIAMELEESQGLRPHDKL